MTEQQPEPRDTDLQFIEEMEKSLGDGDFDLVEQNEPRLRKLVARSFDEAHEAIPARQCHDEFMELHRRASAVLARYSHHKYGKSGDEEFHEPCAGCGRPWGSVVGCACDHYSVEWQVIRRIPVGPHRPHHVQLTA